MSMAGSDGRDGNPVRVDLPQLGVIAQGRDLYLQVQLSTSAYQVYICNIATYEDVARVIHKGIMEAGRDAKRAASGLQVVEGSKADAVVREAKGRK